MCRREGEYPCDPSTSDHAWGTGALQLRPVNHPRLHLNRRALLAALSPSTRSARPGSHPGVSGSHVPGAEAGSQHGGGVAFLRFFYVQVLKRGRGVAETPHPNRVLHSPQVLSQDIDLRGGILINLRSHFSGAFGGMPDSPGKARPSVGRPAALLCSES